MPRSPNLGVVLSFLTSAHIRIRRSTALVAAVLLVAGAMTAGSVAAPDRAEAVGSTLVPARTDELPPGETARISGNMDVTALLAAHPGNKSYTAWLTSEDGQEVYSVLGDPIFSNSIHFGYGGLPAGTYRVAVGTSVFDGRDTETSPLTSVQFLRFGSDTSITLADGEQKVGLTASARSLDARLSGTLSAAGIASGASDVAGARLYERDGDSWVRLPGVAADLTSDGAAPYSVAVPVGTYTVGFEALTTSGDLADEYWQGAATLDSAASITLGAGVEQPGVAGGLVPAGSPAGLRYAGPNRFATSAAVSAASFSPGVPVAYVANGWKFPDALSGAAAAGVLGGPVLLTDEESLPGVIHDELDRLKPQKIVILGSEASVQEGVAKSLSQYSTDVKRVAGEDRFATSAAVSAASFSPGVPVAYLANGWKFPDALAGAAAAGTLGGPVLLTDGESLPAAFATELARLQPAKIVLLGSAGSVSESVRTAARTYTATVERLAGADRFETSAAVSRSTFAPGVPVVYLTNGWKFPDALSGAAAAGSLGGPVLLTNADSLPASIAAELARLKPKRIVVLGDESSVADLVRLAARASAR